MSYGDGGLRRRLHEALNLPQYLRPYYFLLSKAANMPSRSPKETMSKTFAKRLWPMGCQIQVRQ